MACALNSTGGCGFILRQPGDHSPHAVRRGPFLGHRRSTMGARRVLGALSCGWFDPVFEPEAKTESEAYTSPAFFYQVLPLIDKVIFTTVVFHGFAF